MADKAHKLEKHDRLQQEKEEKEDKKRQHQQDEHNEILVRILGYDIPGSRNLIAGLIRIKGVSWAISNALCIKLNLSKSKKIETLTKDEIAKIEAFLRNPQIPTFFFNRRSDRETGETKHFLGSDLDIKKEFDIKRLKEIRSYKGIRHGAKLPVRGQRTRSHFRTKGRAMGIKKK
ncbi:MAG: 30S ribosomal protein S13 [Nanoarchaeota archaeon]